MLCQIPGISSRTAQAIMGNYPTFHELLVDLESNKKCLDEIVYETPTGKSRHISKTGISNLIHYLIQK